MRDTRFASSAIWIRDSFPCRAPGRPDRQFSVAEVKLEDVLDGRHAAGSLIVKPNDVITVPRARLIYVIGEVKKSGGFALHERQNISVLQALALAEGLTRTAGLGGARVLRYTLDRTARGNTAQPEEHFRRQEPRCAARTRRHSICAQQHGQEQRNARGGSGHPAGHRRGDLEMNRQFSTSSRR